MNSNQYPEDEFDFQGKNLPVGSHRKPLPKWRTFMPFIIVLLLAPLCAWGVVFVMDKANQTSTTSTETTTQTTSEDAAKKKAEEEAAAAKAKAEEEAKKKAEEEAKAKAEEEAKKQAEASIDYGVKVKVFNGTVTTGLAARVAEKVRAQEFTNVSAGNNPGINANASTVYYANETSKAAAEKIAQALGIGNVVQDSAAPGGEGIAVLIMQDYRE